MTQSCEDVANSLSHVQCRHFGEQRNFIIPMTKRAVIFDFGGVLMKTVDPSPRLAWDRQLGLQPGHVERIVHGSASWRLAQTGQLPVEDYWQDVAQKLSLDETQLRQLQADYFSGDRLDADLIAYIRRLRTDGFTVALLSNDSPALRDKLTQLGIAELFDPLVISGEIGVMKPDAGAYDAVLARLQRPASEAIFIDDMPVNVEAARARGILTIHYVAGMDLPAALKDLLTV